MASAKTKGTKKIKKNIKSTRDLKMLRFGRFWGVELSRDGEIARTSACDVESAHVDARGEK